MTTMSSRRHLVQRPSQIDNGQSRPRTGASQQQPTLPPYQAPAYPLSAKYQTELSGLTSAHDLKKYQEHLKHAISHISNCTAEAYDQVHNATTEVLRMSKKREERQAESEEQLEVSELEQKAEERAVELRDKLDKIAKDAESSLRELIDYSDELAQQQNIMKSIQEDIAINAGKVPPVGQQAGRGGIGRRGVDDDENQSDDGDRNFDGYENPSVTVDILSATELLRKAKEDYNADYRAKSMRKRYADHNDYIGFKRAVHDAQNPGPNAPPVSHAATWFQAGEGKPEPSRTHTAQRNRTANEPEAHLVEEDDEDDEIQFAGEVASLKCPLTLQEFKVPYSNRKCPHTFEKSAMVEYYNTNAAAEVEPSQGRRRQAQPAGPKFIKCPQSGCDAKLNADDFYDDMVVLRKVKRAQAIQAAEREDDTMMEENMAAGAEVEDDGYDED